MKKDRYKSSGRQLTAEDTNVINNDQRVLDNRKKPLKDVEVPLRDQIVKALYDKLEDQNIGSRVSSAWSQSTASISELLARQQVFLRDKDEHTVNQAEGTFKGSSDLHIPMPFIVSKTYHARFVAALMDVDPPFNVKARREDQTDRVQMIEDLMKYTLGTWCNYNRGIRAVVDEWVSDWVDTGTGVLKIKWERIYTRFTDVEETPEEGIPTVDIAEDGITEVLKPTINMVEKEVKKTAKVFDGPVLEVIPLEDFRMLGSDDPDLADIVMQRTWMTASQLWQNVDEKIFDEDAVEKTIRSGKDLQLGADSSGIKQQRDMNAGKTSTCEEAETPRYEVIEAYLRMDVDGSGISTDVIVWIHNDSRALLRATYLRRVIPSGERPFAAPHFYKRRDQELGVGLLEVLHPLSVELDAHHNMRIDFGLITNNPVGFYRPSSNLDPETIQVEPGMLIPLDNPQTDVYYPPRPNATAFGMQEEGMIQSYIERLTGISDLSLGVQSGQQGATRTASGVRALIGEANTNLNIHLSRLNQGWTKVLRTIWHMLQTRIEPGFAFQVTGDDGQQFFYKILNPSYELGMDIDIEVSSNTANSNKAVQLETSSQIMQLTSNPLYIQLGIVKPNNTYNAIKSYLSALGVKDAHRFITKPVEGSSYQLQPIDEFNRVIRSMDVPVGPADDHAGFIAFAQDILSAQDQAETLSDEQQKLLIAQMQKHQEMQQAMQQQQAQANVAQQMQQNAAMSQNQAPTAINPMSRGDGSLPGVQV